jgi:hypothetical protein
MEEIKLRLSFVIFLLLFSFSCIFAQDNADTNESGNEVSVIEEDVNIKNNSSVSEDLESSPEATESVTVKKAKKNTFTFIKRIPLIYIITCSLLLVMAALIVLSHLYLRKLIHKETGNRKKDIDETIKNIEQKFDGKYNGIINKPQYSSNIDDMRDKYNFLERDVSGIKNEISILKNKVETLYSGKKITENVSSGNLSPAEAFNLWSASPYGPLPEVFYYIEGKMNIRTKRDIKESMKDTLWITNRKGQKKYLFPNPNLFDQMTNIMELYKMDQSKLKGKGQNKLKIITPCEMTKDGFVEFAGELELL